MEDPARWAPWAAPCPIRAEDLARQKEIRARKSRMDQRTRERLPVLPVLVARVYDTRTDDAARLQAARHRPGDVHRRRRPAPRHRHRTARIWAERPHPPGSAAT